MKNYLRNEETQKTIEVLEKEINKPVTDAIVTGINENRGTWIHPRLVTHLATWVDCEFGVKISSWIEEWRAYSEENNKKYLDALCALKPSKSSQLEKEIQLQLKHKFGGDIEVETPYGYVDLVYSDDEHKYVVEIKRADKWKQALGQVLCYGDEFPGYKKVIVLFGDYLIPEKVEHLYAKYDVELRLF
jgi:hypothetical protein